MKKLYLSNGSFSKVDDEDYDFLAQWKWCTNGKAGYARRVEYTTTNGISHQVNYMLHRQLINVPKGLFIDHINHDRLDNRKSNLRICTRSGNAMNKGRQPSKTNYVGVYPHPGGSPTYVMMIGLDHKQVYIGTSDSIEEAAYIRDQVALQLHGEYAVTNFDYGGVLSI